MLNKDLFDSPKDAKIAQLRTTIDAFKRYDEKRKQYVHQLERENQWLQEELRLNTPEKLAEKLKNQTRQLAALTTAIERYHLSLKYSEEQIAQWKSEFQAARAHEHIAKLQSERDHLRKENKDLVAQLYNLKAKANQAQ